MAFRSPPEDTDFTAARGRILSLMGRDFLAAEGEAESWLERAPGDRAVVLLRAYLLNFRKEHVAAAELLARAAETAPGDAEIGFNLAYCRLQAGDIEGAAAGFASLNGADALLLAWLCGRWRGGSAPAPEIGGLGGAGLAARWFKSAAAAGLRPSLDRAAGLVDWLNRHDVPGWGALDDKARLAPLLAAHRFRHAPQTHWLAANRPLPDGGWWIAKHGRLFGGQAVQICADPRALPLGGGWIVQRYIAEPRLHEGRKFHLRFYLAILEGRERHAALHADAIARLALLPYDPADPDQRRHVTNTLRFRDDPAAKAGAKVVDLEALGLAPETLARIADLARDLARIAFTERIAFLHLDDRADPIPPKLLGLDIVVDRGDRPWLLEVERYPALHGGSPAADAVNARLFRDFALLIAGARSDRWIGLS